MRFSQHGLQCRFLGHFFGHDVHVCTPPGDLGASILARYGDEGHEYASMPLQLLLESLSDPDRHIGGQDADGQPWRMRYVDWVFSERRCPATAAMVLGLAVLGAQHAVSR